MEIYVWLRLLTCSVVDRDLRLRGPCWGVRKFDRFPGVATVRLARQKRRWTRHCFVFNKLTVCWLLNGKRGCLPLYIWKAAGKCGIRRCVHEVWKQFPVNRPRSELRVTD